MIFAHPPRRSSAMAAAVVLGVLLSPAAWGADYKFTTIDYGMNTDTELYGINSSGVATGITYDDNGQAHGIVVKGGVVSLVDAPGSGTFGTYLYQVNAYGFVASSYYDAQGISHATLYNLNAKTFLPLPDVPRYPFNAAGGINNAFEVAGNISADASGTSGLVAWIINRKQYQFFVDPASSQPMLGTVTYALNDSGTLVGYYLDAKGVPHGFSTPGNLGPFTQIDYPKADNTEAFGINNYGTIAGRYRVGDVRHGFLLTSAGRYSTVDVPGASQTWITAINDRGDLAGFFEDADGDYHGFLARK